MYNYHNDIIDINFTDDKRKFKQESFNSKKYFDLNLEKNKIIEIFEKILSSKLIISKDSNLLIIKPLSCFELINHLKNSNITIKLEIIEKLSWMINRIHSNAFILTTKTELKQIKSNISFSFFNELIDILYDNDKEEIFRDNLINLLERIIYFSGLKESYLSHVFIKINILFTKFDGNKFHLMIKLLNVNFIIFI